MIRVVLVDDQELVRSGVRMMLERFDDIAIVGEASNGREALDLIPAARPDVVLMDVRMPTMDGIQATRLALTAPTPPAIVVLTTFDLDDAVFDALEAGASGFLLKDASAVELSTAVRAAAAGEGVLAPAVILRVMARAAERSRVVVSDPRSTKLTAREREVVTALSGGLNNAEIGAQLYLSEATVKSHLTSILAKLGLRDRTQVVIWALRSGFTSQEGPPVIDAI